jgi:CBS domain-containing protein
VQCPACDHENIPGTDLCEECGTDLAGLDVTAWGVDPTDPGLALSLADVALKQPLRVTPRATVREAVDRMRESREGCVFVEDAAGLLVGVFTERDLTARVVAAGRDLDATRIDEVMTRNPVALQKSDPLAWALHRMGVEGYRHLPVLDGERLTGFLSVRTVLGELLRA